jgi:hypothetical protein
MLVLVALSVLAAAAPASAQTTEDVTTCQALIADVRTSTVNSTTFVTAKDQTGLLGKLDTATVKLEQGKPENALQVLIQYRDKVSTLVAQGKLDPADGQLLLDGDTDTGGVNDAITCVQGLIA